MLASVLSKNFSSLLIRPLLSSSRPLKQVTNGIIFYPLDESNSLEWNQRTLVSTNYRFFVEIRRPPLRREDYLKENEEMGLELSKQEKPPAGEDISHHTEAERFSRGDDDGKRPPQDLSKDYSKSLREIKGVNPRNTTGEPPKKYDQGSTIYHAAQYDAPNDWAKIIGYEELKKKQSEEKKLEEEKIVHIGTL